MTNSVYLPPPSTEGIRRAIKDANVVNGMPWQRINEITGIPIGTLTRFARGGKLPRKWKANLGLKYYQDLWDMPVGVLRRALDNRTEEK